MYDCIHGDDPNLCPPCQNDREGEAMDVVTKTKMRVIVTAEYVTECRNCPDDIQPGDPITPDDTSDAWVHVNCA